MAGDSYVFDSLVWYTAVWVIVFVHVCYLQPVIVNMNALKYQYLHIIITDPKANLMTAFASASVSWMIWNWEWWISPHCSYVTLHSFPFVFPLNWLLWYYFIFWKYVCTTIQHKHVCDKIMWFVVMWQLKLPTLYEASKRYIALLFTPVPVYHHKNFI